MSKEQQSIESIAQELPSASVVEVAPVSMVVRARNGLTNSRRVIESAMDAYVAPKVELSQEQRVTKLKVEAKRQYDAVVAPMLERMREIASQIPDRDAGAWIGEIRDMISGAFQRNDHALVLGEHTGLLRDVLGAFATMERLMTTRPDQLTVARLRRSDDLLNAISSLGNPSVMMNLTKNADWPNLVRSQEREEQSAPR